MQNLCPPVISVFVSLLRHPRLGPGKTHVNLWEVGGHRALTSETTLCTWIHTTAHPIRGLAEGQDQELSLSLPQPCLALSACPWMGGAALVPGPLLWARVTVMSASKAAGPSPDHDLRGCQRKKCSNL